MQYGKINVYDKIVTENLEKKENIAIKAIFT